MRLAVIDCGTNTFNLLIVDVKSRHEHSKVYNTRIPVKLGEGSINQGYIGEAAFQRALEAIASFNKSIQQHSASKTLAFATSAIRDAANGKDLVEQIEKKFNISIDVIDGNKEAELIYFGVREAVKLNDIPSLIMDIGGGSTEFILASREKIYWKQSYNIGAARLLGRFKPSDPITAGEEKAITDYLASELATLADAVEKYRPLQLVGSSGAFESIIEMIHSEMGGEELHSGKTEYDIDIQKHFKISRAVIGSTLAQRKNMKGLVPMRQDMIVISCLMVDFILNRFSLDKLKVSTYSLKEGALVDFIDKELK